jgi:hypothetical protein
MSQKCFTALVLSVCLLSAGTCWGDNFSFSLGVGHVGHGPARPHCYAPHYGAHYHWFAPPPRYVYVEPPVVQERIYVQPAVVQERVVVQQAAPSYETRYSAPVARNAAPVNVNVATAPVVIRNASGKGYDVSFVLNETNAELADGQTRSFNAQGKHIVEFDRGGDRGTAHYELEGGLYSFVITNNGWDLVKDTSTPTQTAKRPLLRRNELPDDVKIR